MRRYKEIVLCEMCGGKMTPKIFDKVFINNRGYPWLTNKEITRISSEVGKFFFVCSNCVFCRRVSSLEVEEAGYNIGLLNMGGYQDE